MTKRDGLFFEMVLTARNRPYYTTNRPVKPVERLAPVLGGAGSPPLNPEVGTHGTACVVRRPRPGLVSERLTTCQGDASVPTPHNPSPAPTGSKDVIPYLAL